MKSKTVRVVDIKFNDKFYLEQDIKTMAKQVLDVMPKAKDVKELIKQGGESYE